MCADIYHLSVIPLSVECLLFFVFIMTDNVCDSWEDVDVDVSHFLSSILFLCD